MISSTPTHIILDELIKSSSAFLQSSDFKQATRTAYDCCKKIIGSTAGYVALLSADKLQNELLFLDMGGMQCYLNPNQPMPVRGLRAKSYSSGEVVYENNFPQSEWLEFLPDGHGRLDNVLFAPLIIDNNPAGIFGFANKPGGFCEDSALIARTFAELAAIGLLQNQTANRFETTARRLSALLETVHDAVITLDKQGNVFSWNTAAEKLFGYSSAEMIGNPCIKIIPAQHRKKHSEIFAKIAETGISKLAGMTVEIEALRKNNEIFPAELSLSKLNIDDTVFFTGIIRDTSLHKKLVQETREAERRLRKVFEHMKGGGGIYKAVDDGKDFLIIDFHRPEIQELKKKKKDLRGKKILEVFPASKKYGLFEVFQRVWKTGKPEIHPVKIYNDKEITGWRENYVYKLPTGEIVALYEDFTESKKMEMALQESENLFRTIFETSPSPINISRLKDGKFVAVNNSFLKLSGYEENEVIGKTAIDLNIWKDINKRAELFARIFKHGQVDNVETEFRTRDGSILCAQISAKLISYKNEPHVLGVTKDITELKNAEKNLLKAHNQLKKKFKIRSAELKESQIKYSSLIEALLTGVYMCVGEKIIFTNMQFENLLGYTHDELQNMNLRDLIHPEDREVVIPTLNSPKKSASIESDFEVRGLTKRGDTIYLHIRNTVVEHNGQQAILGNVADISNRKLAEKEKQKTNEELRILSGQLLSAEERERKRIANDIHDTIGQALSAVKFSVENSLAAINKKSFSAASRSLESIIPLTQQTIEEVRRIIMDLRPSTLDDLGLISTISWLCREFNSIYSHISIEKEIHLEETDIPLSLKSVIYRILQEALNNAAKHSQTEIIRLHLMKNIDSLEFLFEDSGVGFDLNEVQSRGGDLKGMGFGSMKERAQMSNGSLKIQSSPGVGTTIHVSWPLQEAVNKL